MDSLTEYPVHHLVAITHTSSDFHKASYMEKTNNSETLDQATQTSALMNQSYVSNDASDGFYVDYIKFKKYVDDIINSLNTKTKYAKNLEVTTIEVN